MDAEKVFAYTEETSIEYPKLGQIGFSDMVIRNGVDPVDEYNYKSEGLDQLSHPATAGLSDLWAGAGSAVGQQFKPLDNAHLS